jgi:hypothetical protein
MYDANTAMSARTIFNVRSMVSNETAQRGIEPTTEWLGTLSKLRPKTRRLEQM